MCSDLGSGSRCCAFYSATGFIFTLWVGAVLHTQPFFIIGIDDSEASRNNALGAMVMFIVTFVLSLGGLWYDSNNKQKESPYADGEDAYNQLAEDIVPNYGTSN